MRDCPQTIEGIRVTGPNCPYCRKPMTTANARCIIRHWRDYSHDRLAHRPAV